MYYVERGTQTTPGATVQKNPSNALLIKDRNVQLSQDPNTT